MDPTFDLPAELVAVLVAVALFGGLLLRRPTAGGDHPDIWSRDLEPPRSLWMQDECVFLAFLREFQPGRELTLFTLGSPPMLLATRSARFAARAGWALGRAASYECVAPPENMQVILLISSESPALQGFAVVDGSVPIEQREQRLLQVIANALDSSSRVPLDSGEA